REELNNDIGVTPPLQPHSPIWAHGLTVDPLDKEEIRPPKIAVARLDRAEVDKHIATDIKVVPLVQMICDDLNQQVHRHAMPLGFQGLTVRFYKLHIGQWGEFGKRFNCTQSHSLSF